MRKKLYKKTKWRKINKKIKRTKGKIFLIKKTWKNNKELIKNWAKKWKIKQKINLLKDRK